jgi:hypothetical protein
VHLPKNKLHEGTTDNTAVGLQSLHSGQDDVKDGATLRDILYPKPATSSESFLAQAVDVAAGIIAPAND